MAIVIAYLAMAKPYYTLYYNFMIINYFYLNQENFKTRNDSNGIRTHNHLVRKPTLANWMFDYELNGCGFEFPCCHLNFRYGACFE